MTGETENVESADTGDCDSMNDSESMESQSDSPGTALGLRMRYPGNRGLLEGALSLNKALEKYPRLTSEIRTESQEGVPTVVVGSYRALVRVVGYFQYHLHGKALLRGQHKCYRSLLPSLYRQDSGKDFELDAFLDAYRQWLGVDTLPAQQLTTEPLLQHYGLRTRWIDLVDSIPHALFFATNRFATSYESDSLHTYIPSLHPKGYLYVIELETPQTFSLSDGTAVSGFWKCGNCLLADLRAAKPSLALRPHSQHGLLCRYAEDAKNDLWPLVRARITFPMRLARQWIAGAEALSRDSLFPDRFWDGIYGKLLSRKTSAFLESQRRLGRDFGAIVRYDFSDDSLFSRNGSK